MRPLVIACVVTGLLAAAPADARGFVGLGVTVPVYPAYPPPPPVYYPAAPPPYAYPPPPVYAMPGAPAASQQTCREYQTTTIIDGRPQPTYGRACLQSDGSWRIVR